MVGAFSVEFFGSQYDLIMLQKPQNKQISKIKHKEIFDTIT